MTISSITSTNISSNYLANALLPAVQQAQTQLSTLETEATTGQYANLGLQLGGQSGYELSLRSQDDLLQAMTSANGLVATNMSTAQSALTSILSSAQTAAQSLVGAASDDSATTIQTLGQSNLAQLIAVGNTTAATGGYIFGGENSGTAPLDDYYSSPTSNAKTAVDGAFQSYFGFSTTSAQVSGITASQMDDFLTGPYAALFQGSNWQSDWSTASSTNTSTTIAPAQTVETSTNANTAGFQQLAQGYTMLSEFGNIGLSSAAQKALVSSATTTINQGVSSVTATQAQLGGVQAQVTDANNAMSSQMTLIQTELGRMDNVNADQIATELTTLSTQLETAYQLTSQIHNLNLAQYLPT